MTEKKEAPSSPDLAAENAELRERLARAEGRTEGAALALQTQPFLMPEERTLAEIYEREKDRRPKPQRWYAGIERTSHTGFIVLACPCTKRPDAVEGRIIKPDMPLWIPATEGPAIRPHPAARRAVDRETAGIIPEPALREAVLLMLEGKFIENEFLTRAYVAGSHDALWAKGRLGSQNRITRLVLPIMRLCGQLASEAREACTYFEEIGEGQPLPAGWLERLQDQGAEMVVRPAETRVDLVPPRPPQHEEPPLRQAAPPPFPRY